MGQESPFTEGYETLCQRIGSADPEAYLKLHGESIENREAYWKMNAGRIGWDTPFDSVVDENFDTAEISWFNGGKLNAYRNIFGTAGDSGGKNAPSLAYYLPDMTVQQYDSNDLAAKVRQTAAGLSARDITTGDRVALYLHDCPETVFLMLACSLLGVTYVPVPPRFTPEVAAEIVEDCGAKLLLIALDSPSPTYLERAQSLIGKLTDVTIVTTGAAAEGVVAFSELADGAGADAAPVSVDAEHPLYILYANSATGIPRGSVFATGGYLVQAAASYDCIFGACGIESVLTTVDLASSAGQAYGLWGPLLNGSTIILTAVAETIHTGNLSDIMENRSSVGFLTSPRAITALKSDQTEGGLDESKRFSLVATCGDVLTPRLVKFAAAALTTAPERVINLWIQSESGTAVINTYPSVNLNSPGALGRAFPGVQPLVINTMGEPCRPNESGQLVFSGSWPAMIRAIWGQEERYRELYFLKEPGYFCTNDGVRVDAGGEYWFMGRLDDVIKVRGQSLATSEIEAVLITHDTIDEAVVVSVGIGDGWQLYAFLVLHEGTVENTPDEVLDDFRAKLADHVTRRIGEFAVPDMFIFTGELPRTKTGKIVRRILRRVAVGDISPEEDLSHVANPESIDKIMKSKDI